VFSPQTNDFQKPIKFVSTSGKVFFGKESEKASEEKPVEKPSGEKPSEQPKPMKDQMATREGRSEKEPVKILHKEPGLYPSQIPVTHKRWIESHANRQDNEVMDQPLVLGTIP
jgi:hypothetical protein